MPKMKTNSSAKKRFKITGSGKIKRSQAYKRHILTKKSTKRKRALTGTTIIRETDMANAKKLLVLS
ncbi:MAG TPA: 50S ribosomal protein L35 [Chitinophagales bacterium]|nr:50S ribosomal protein L35 [Chitinophagales bacterium]HNL83967.1 50S ribosomal protein L35 [Chitinophagales bacterium]